MFRKCAAALVALVLVMGSVFAEEVKGAFVKFADGKLTVKVDDKEKEYKVPADLKIKRKNKNGDEIELVVTDMLNKLNDAKNKPNLTLDVDKDTVKGVKVERKQKGK